MSSKKQLGQWGEDLASKFYVDKGYELVDKNYYLKSKKLIAEIDLIVAKDKEVVFVEVKTRTSKAYGYGEQAVNYSKKQKISKAINQFCTLNEKYDDYFPRFDIMVVEVMDLIPKFIHFENIELNC